MPTKWHITMTITDLNNRYNEKFLMDDIKSKWMPVNFNLMLDKIEVVRVKTVTTEN